MSLKAKKPHVVGRAGHRSQQESFQRLLAQNLFDLLEPKPLKSGHEKDAQPIRRSRTRSFLYALLMIPTALDRCCGALVVGAGLLSVPINFMYSEREFFKDTLYFSYALTFLTSALQELYLQADFRACKICRAVIPAWRRWAPFYFVLFSFAGCLAESSARIVHDSWLRQDCRSLFFVIPYSENCALVSVTDQYAAHIFIARIVGLILLWCGIIWATEIPMTFMSDYKNARDGTLYEPLNAQGLPAGALSSPDVRDVSV